MIGRRDFCSYQPLFLPSSSYFILAVPMRECLGKHSCMSSPCPIAILNGTFHFLRGAIVCNFGQSFVYENQIKLNSSPFCFLLNEFHCSFSIFYKIIQYYVMFINTVCWLGCDRLSGLLLFVPALFPSILTTPFLFSSGFFVLFHSWCSHAWVFGKTLLREFPVSYSHTGWYFLFSLFGAREYKHAQRTLL